MFQVRFTKSSARDWSRLEKSIRTIFAKKLKRASAPGASRVRLRGFGGNLYKLKLTAPQFRLVYRIDEEANQLIVIAVGHRDTIYQELSDRR